MNYDNLPAGHVAGEWVEHDGGPMPVDGNTLVQVRRRGPVKSGYTWPKFARLYRWEHETHTAVMWTDILWYRVITKGEGA